MPAARGDVSVSPCEGRQLVVRYAVDRAETVYGQGRGPVPWVPLSRDQFVPVDARFLCQSVYGQAVGSAEVLKGQLERVAQRV